VTTRADELAALRTHVTQVVRTAQVTPHVRRITFGGGDLETYEPLGPDQFLYLLLPPPGRADLTIDAGFTWESYWTMPDDEKPVGAYYTVRYHRPERAEIDIDVVLHDEAGAASAWAANAQPGDPAALWGPRQAFAPPADTDWYLLVADESGLPATAAILDWLPPGAVVRAFVGVPDASEEQPLAAGGDRDVVVTWLHRGDRPAGTTTQLIDAVRSLEMLGGKPYAWGGGESRAVTAVRRYLRDEVGLERAQVSMTGYWRHPAHTEDLGDPDEED
jgi:NADPH-dependent ferric siderophore reductase